MKKQKIIALALCFTCSASWSQLGAQQIAIEPIRPTAPVFVRPYLPADVPPVRLGNSGRFADLIRGGNLYLTAQDAIAFALENNIDIEVARYNPIMLEWRLERSEAGGALPGVPSAASQTTSVASGQGVLGSQAAAGVTGGNNGTVRGAANATISQIGPVTQNLDPTIQEATTFSHRSLPQANATQAQTQVIVQGQRIYSASYQQGLLSGGSVTVSYNNHFLNENAPSDVLNPSVAPTASISVQHNLLQGFGTRVGGRNITIAKLNLQMSDLTLRNQVSRTVLTVLSTYYSLVGDYEDLRSKQIAIDTAQKFLSESQRRLELGALAQLDVTTAQNQVASARLALVNSQVLLEQHELQLKNLISRTGLSDPAIAGVHIIPLDTLSIPPADDLPPIPELVKRAAENRPDLLSEQANLRTTEISNLGTQNGVLPSLQVFAARTNAGLAGTPRVVTTRIGTQTADARFVGGIGNALGQIFRQNFPTENAGVFARVPIQNRQAQADLGIDQLSLRQQQLNAARDLNQSQVDVVNSVVALTQARARYDAAAQNKILQQQLFDAEQKKFAAGESTSYNVTQQQRDLTNAQAAEIAALVSYRNARLNLDQTTGMTLETYHISLADVKTGKAPQPSALPATLPEAPGR